MSLLPGILISVMLLSVVDYRLTRESDAVSKTRLRGRRAVLQDVDKENQFVKILGEKYFVDKTLFIKTLLDATKEDRTSNNLITAPRRFGKTVNLEMFKAFIGIAVDENGLVIADKKNTPNYRLFQGLKIMKYNNYVNLHLAKHPVIHMDFKTVSGVHSLNNLVGFFKEILNVAFDQHSYLLKCPQLWVNECRHGVDTFNMYRLTDQQHKLDRRQVQNGLQTLSEILMTRFKKQVVVLIDDYDAPQKDLMLTKLRNAELIQRSSKFINIFLSNGLKSNACVRRSLITGVLHLSGGVDLSTINNIAINKFLFDHKFVQYYGFTEEEVGMLFLRNKISVDLQEKAKAWYDGYSSAANVKLYSPLSIIGFLKNKVVKNYWAQQSTVMQLSNLIKAPEVKSMVLNLIAGKAITVTLQNSINVKEFQTFLEQYSSAPEKITGFQIDLYFQFLFELGYLSFKGKQHLLDEEDDVSLIAPNVEITRQYINTTETYFQAVYHVTNNDKEEIGTALNGLTAVTRAKTFATFVKALNEHYSKLSVGKHVEMEYQLFLYAFTRDIFPESGVNWRVTSTVENGKKTRGLIDILYKRKGGVGIIIEMKIGNSKNSSVKALNQTLNRKYYNVLYKKTDKEVKNIILMGINVNTNRKVSVSYLIDSCNISEQVTLAN